MGRVLPQLYFTNMAEDFEASQVYGEAGTQHPFDFFDPVHDSKNLSPETPTVILDRTSRSQLDGTLNGIPVYNGNSPVPSTALSGDYYLSMGDIVYRPTIFGLLDHAYVFVIRNVCELHHGTSGSGQRRETYHPRVCFRDRVQASTDKQLFLQSQALGVMI